MTTRTMAPPADPCPDCGEALSTSRGLLTRCRPRHADAAARTHAQEDDHP